MTPAELLSDLLERSLEVAGSVVDGLPEDDLTRRPGPEANTIAWLVWHLARVQDSHVAEVAEREQVWTEEGYVDRFGLSLDEADTGFAHTPDQVALVSAPADLLLDYLRAVHSRSAEWVGTLQAEDLDRVVDSNWDPPVTLGVRLVSVANDCAQHAGQAAYVRGLLGR